jgi:tRNA pseudouridine55 synthase
LSRRPKAYTDRPAPPDGLVIVDKPGGWTSHDVVGKMRRLVGTRRVGHAGTLDPMATGVLVLGVERATRPRRSWRRSRTRRSPPGSPR